MFVVIVGLREEIVELVREIGLTLVLALHDLEGLFDPRVDFKDQHGVVTVVESYLFIPPGVVHLFHKSG